MKENPNTKEHTEYTSVYLTKEDKVQFEANKDNYDLQLNIINKYFTSEKKWIKDEMQQIDDNLLQYRALLLRTREAVKEAQNEHYDKINDFWDEIAKGIPSFKDKVEKITEKISPILFELEKIKNMLNNVSTYQLEGIMKLVSTFSNMSNKDKEFFMILFEHSKNKE